MKNYTIACYMVLLFVMGFGFGLFFGFYRGMETCVNIGLKLLSIDGVVNISFSDAMKAILSIYRGELIP